MKKICIVTWYGGINYGTNLQAYALYRHLESMGYDVDITGSIRRCQSFIKHPLLFINKVIEKYANKRGVDKKQLISDTEKKYERRFQNRKNIFQYFIQNSFCFLNINGVREWRKVRSEYACFITGSDQVWNPNYFRPIQMLDFVDTTLVRKISYAPSIGVTQLEPKIKKRYKKLLKSYNAISVREENAVQLLEKLVPCDVKVVVDPTMLINRQEWDKLSEKAIIQEEWNIKQPYILCYFVGERRDYWGYVDKVQQETGYQVIVIPMEEASFNEKYKLIIEAGPAEFVWLIQHAAIVCTDSFHATVFSILYHREFYILPRFKSNNTNSQNGRLYHILEIFDLSDRWITDEVSFERNMITNYKIVDRRLEKMREESNAFLINAIEGKK